MCGWTGSAGSGISGSMPWAGSLVKSVTGDLRLGGSFELDGGEHGEILRCEPPRLLRVSWLFRPEAAEWPGTSEVEVRLPPGPAGDTEREAVHAAAVGEPMFPTYGPGAGGAGWDLHLLTLARFLVHGEILGAAWQCVSVLSAFVAMLVRLKPTLSARRSTFTRCARLIQLVVFATPYLASIISTASSTTCAIDASSGDQLMSSIRGQKT